MKTVIIVGARVLGRFKISKGVGRPWDSIFVMRLSLLPLSSFSWKNE